MGLKGLASKTVEELPDWRCPRCIMKKMGSTMSIIQDTVKTELEKAVPKIVKSVVEATVKAKEFQRTFADVAAGRAEHMEKKVERTVEKTMQSAIKENQQAILQKATEKQDADHFERERRKRNIVIKNVRESKMNTADGRFNSDVSKILQLIEVEKEDIITCYRAGAKRTNGDPRLLIVTLATPYLAQHCHNYGSGRKMETNGDKKDIWINEDRTKADRDADYRARKLKRERRAEMESKRNTKPAPKEEEDQKPNEAEAKEAKEPRVKDHTDLKDKRGDSDVSVDSVF